MLHAIIMAGGAGTRFWPASRTALPKQLLDLVGGRTMIQATLDRLGDLVSPERTLIVTNERLVDAIRQQLPQLPAQAVVGEPCKRDTAPCVGLAAILVSREDADATMIVMPADHVIATDDQFRGAVTYAAELVEQRPERIVTFGIRPTYAAESFGYIERGEPMMDAVSASAAVRPQTFHVSRFREKPTAEVARQFLESGNFYWNAGIFVWKAKTILAALAKHEPEMFSHLQRIGEAFGTADYANVFAREFAAIRGKSIDYAVMERHDAAIVVEAPYQWDDVGNWPSLARLRGTDENGNTLAGKHLAINTKGTIVRSSNDHLVVTVGMEDCIVVHTPDATLVANKHDEESIRKVVELLKERGWEEYL
jgi:mannose-1-phosphate guanylyltransferase